jgi:hypothetical protein
MSDWLHVAVNLRKQMINGNNQCDIYRKHTVQVQIAGVMVTQRWGAHCVSRQHVYHSLICRLM